MKMLIGTPAIDKPTWGMTESLRNMYVPMSNTFMAMRGYGGTDHARNMLVQQMLDENYDWLLMVDADARLHPGTVIRLLERRKKIISALCFKREVPIVPAAGDGERGIDEYYIDEMRGYLWKHKSLMETEGRGYALLTPPPEDSLLQRDFVGMHTTLIHRSVFLKVRKPWFQRSQGHATAAREDINFLRKARKAGFKAWLDRSVVSGHQWGEWAVGVADFLIWAEFIDWKSQQEKK